MPDFKTPGQLILHLMENRGWSQRVLSVVLSVHETAINKVILGRRRVDAELALALGEAFGLPPERFLELQQTYDLAQARVYAPIDLELVRRANLFGTLPIVEMIERGWLKINDVKDVRKIEGEVARFFGAPSLNDVEVLPRAAKKTNVSSEVTPAQLAWLYRVNQIASEMEAPPYSDASGKGVLAKLNASLASVEGVGEVPGILAEGGIRLAFVEGLAGAKIDGACLWLDDSKPVIALALRHDRIDRFWFVLRHELEHVLAKHGRTGPMLDVELEGDRAGAGPGVADEERVANEAAADFCLRKQPPDESIAAQFPPKTGRRESRRVHPVKVRSIVAQRAVTDGWGDVVLVENQSPVAARKAGVESPVSSGKPPSL
jgi:HTH-type transcriptional regulator/antitoxin HigA